MGEKAQMISFKCKWFLWFTAIARCILQLGIPIIGFGYANDDDVLMAEYADSLLRMQWMGEYSVSAMNKVPGFSIFLAISRFFNISYPLALGLLYCLAAVIFFFAIRKLTKNDIVASIFYLYVLFSPAMMTANTVQRVYRNSVLPALVLIIVSCYLAMFLERRCEWKKLIPWSLCCSVFFGFFYIAREDSTWLNCFVFGAIVLTLGTLIIKEKGLKRIKNFLPVICCIFLPVLVSTVCINSVKLMNYRYYGLYEATDFSGTYFADATKSILKIKQDEEIQYVWVTYDTIEKVYEVSPTFAQIQPDLDALYNESVQFFGSGADDGEIEKGYIIWAIRWAAANAGIYDDPQVMNDFYKSVHEEIEAAFEDGRLEKSDKIILSNLARPTEWDEIFLCMKTMFQCLNDALAGYTHTVCSLENSVGNEDNLALMNHITGGVLVGYPADEYCFRGWAVALNEEDMYQMFLIDSTGETRYPIISPSVEVYNYLQEQDIECVQAQRCRFEFVLPASEAENCTVYLINNGELVFEGTPEEFDVTEIPGIEKAVDQAGVVDATDEKELYYGRYVKLANLIISAYRATGGLVVFVAILGCVYEVLRNLIRRFKKQAFDFTMAFLQIGLLLTIFANAFMVSFNYWGDYDGMDMWHNYTGGIYPVWHVFVCISVFCLGKSVMEMIASKRERKTATQVVQEEN